MPLFGTMYTLTTYCCWLRGDQRGWVDDGLIMPPLAALEHIDRLRVKHDRYSFDDKSLLSVGAMLGGSLVERLQQRILALTVQKWHVHFVVAASEHMPPEIVKCAKDAVRYGLRAGRPIWADSYDKRFCFGALSLASRIRYVERHNVAMGWPARPWPFIVDVVNPEGISLGYCLSTANGRNPESNNKTIRHRRRLQD
jgi:hypothetical protein